MKQSVGFSEAACCTKLY